MSVQPTAETNPLGIIFQPWDYKLTSWISKEIILQGSDLLKLQSAANPDDFTFIHGN